MDFPKYAKKNNIGFFGRHKALTFAILPIAAFILILAAFAILLAVSVDAIQSPDDNLQKGIIKAIVYVSYYFIEFCITFLIAGIFCLIAFKLHASPKWPAFSCFSMALLGLILVVTFKVDGPPGTNGLYYGGGIFGLEYYVEFLISPKGLRLYLPILTFLAYIMLANWAQKASDVG